MPFLYVQVVAQPPAPPTPPRMEGNRTVIRPDPDVRVSVDGVEIGPGFGRDPVLAYEAARMQRSELRDQIGRLQEMRTDLQQEITEGGLEGAALAGVQARIAAIDQRISGLDAQLAQADAMVAQLAGVPGAIQPSRRNPNEVPEEAMVIGILMILFVFFPLTVAIARRIWKRTTSGVMRMPAEWNERMHRLEQAVDTIAVEVERVTEGQRFMTRVITERGLGTGAAQPVELPARDPVAARRPEG